MAEASDKPVKKATKKTSKKESVTSSNSKLIYIDDFLSSASPLFYLSSMQVAGFKVFMKGRLYQTSMDKFVKELETYLGRKVR